MEKIMITGATGQLGGLTLEHLLRKENISNSQVVALARRKDEKLLNKGIEVRIADYEDSEALDKALTGIDKLLLISSPALDNALRLKQQFNVVMSAKKNNIKHIVLVSLANPEKRLFGLEDVDMAIEHMIFALDMPYTIMRNPVYLNEILYDLKFAVESGMLISSTKGKEFNYVLKSDLALANATVLSEDGHQNKVYDLSNNELMTYPEIAKIISDITGKSIKYEERTAEEVIANMIKSNIDKDVAELLVNSFQKLIAENQFTDTCSDLKMLLGNRVSSKKEAILSLID